MASGDESFANAVWSDWDDAMDRFFERVSVKAQKRGLTNDEVKHELERGYGYEVADEWAGWVEG